jgi:uncharacterized protein
MKLLFVDTSGWISLVNKSESCHQKATEIYQAKYVEGYRIITHYGVMLETGNGLSNFRLRQMAVSLKRKLDNSPRIEQVEIDEELYQAGWKLYAERLDKDWGVVDCISFIVIASVLSLWKGLELPKH